VEHPRNTSGARLACLVLLLTVAGCGGGSQRLSKSELIVRADAICARTDAQAAKAGARIIVPHTPDGPRQAFIRTARATLPISDRGLAELHALRPPSVMAGDWKRFLADVQKEDAAGHALLRAAQSQDTILAAETQQSLQTVQLDLETVSTKDGFSICGKPARA
jgi:hypothetical protein